MDILDSVIKIKGIGEKSVPLLQKLDINTVSDLIRYYPRDYDEYKMPVPIKDIKEGETVSVEGAISRLTSQMGRKKVVTCYVSDPSGAIKLIWFNQPYIAKLLKPGYRYLFRGVVKREFAEFSIAQPKVYGRNEYLKLMDRLSPVYSLTKGITSNFLSKAVGQVLDEIDIEETLPAAFRKQNNLMKLSDALKTIHFPKTKEEALLARRRLVFDEFLEFISAVRRLKEEKTEERNSYIIDDFSSCDRLLEKLPFELTNDQKKCFSSIKNDMSSKKLMSRMVEGDVGSGKTVIAMLAMLSATKSGYQAALMVPTEVLAKQHFKDFSEQLSEFGIRTELLTGSQTLAQKKKIYKSIENGETDIVIGTHALIQEAVNFRNLALAVIDEQHRFGVKQRQTLKEKGLEPHILSMSATPIPRSLSLILYGDMDLSVIKEMPKERLPIKNCVVDTGYRPTAYNFIRKEILSGHQAYIICPMVEYSEESDGENVIDYTDNLKEFYNMAYLKDGKGKDINIEYLHGKMKPQEKNEVMERFARGEINILVSTTVIEVGVNVKNATVMMIENSEKFGLAQLHQLRGRVGRGSYQSYCIFMKGCEGKDIDERLDILKSYNDGFKVAEEDLRLRGPGDLFGVRQSGEMSWKLADIYADADLLALASEWDKENGT
ncbi:MAG: ATP-dependent DNA helicase RecG [Lachnospiraceae bacterium]|nr:ATP-dependent DNA helicase RecG [Lachnospiraceae bacterium]